MRFLMSQKLYFLMSRKLIILMSQKLSSLMSHRLSFLMSQKVNFIMLQKLSFLLSYKLNILMSQKVNFLMSLKLSLNKKFVGSSELHTRHFIPAHSDWRNLTILVYNCRGFCRGKSVFRGLRITKNIEYEI